MSTISSVHRAGDPVYRTVGQSKSLYVAALYKTLRARKEAPTVVLTYNQVAAQRLYADLSSLLPDVENLLLYPAVEVDPHEEVTRDLGVEQARLLAIEAVLRRSGLVIAPVQAVAERLVPKETYIAHRREITMDSVIEIGALTEDLVAMGYERVDRVDGPGQFSVRGGIIDVYPLTEPYGIRVELFDTDVDSIRTFDPATQRSIDKLERVVIGPAREALFPAAALDSAVEAIERAARLQAEVAQAGCGGSGPFPGGEDEPQLGASGRGHALPGIDQYKPYFHDKLETLLDYVDESQVILVDEPARVREQVTAHLADYAERHALQLEKGRILPDQEKLLASWNDIYERLKAGHALYLSGLAKRVAGMEPTAVISVEAKNPESFFGRFDRLVDGLKRWRKNRYRICFVLSSEERTERVAESLRSEGLDARVVPELNGELRGSHLLLTTGSLSTGCELTRERLVVLTDSEVFGRSPRRRPTRRSRVDKGSTAQLDSFTDLKPGDYVVHVNHGIGLYKGVETLNIGGVHKDYLVVQYAGDDKLYVPTDQVDLLQKYIGSEDTPPRLYRLGGTVARVKKRVKENVKRSPTAS